MLEDYIAVPLLRTVIHCRTGSAHASREIGEVMDAEALQLVLCL
jgi:hypothetical protein